MNAHNLIICGLIFIILTSNVYAICQEPDISTYRSCTSACPDPVKYTMKHSECVNSCISSWNKLEDEYYSCQETERQQAEQKKIEEQKKLEEQKSSSPEVAYPTFHETSYAINLNKGEVELTRNGVIFPINSDFRVFPGDSIRTGGDGVVELVSEDNTVQFGENTLAKMLGIDPANSRVISSPAWFEDPNYKHELDNWKFWEDTLVDLADFVNENRPDYLKSCAIGDIKGCAWGTVTFIKSGVGWFNDKIKKDFKKSMVVTPTAVITPDGTEFIVEVASDGATTVTTLNGTVIVMDLTSRKSVIVESNHKLTIPNTSAGLGEQELQQNLAEIDPESIDRRWIEGAETPKSRTLMIFSITLLIVVTAAGIIALLLAKRKRPQKKQ